MSAMAPKPFAPKPFISKPFAPKPLAPKPFAPKTTRRGTGLSSDAALGLVGCSLAAASATFGIVMTMHGPVATLGRSGNFTVFAQLAPRAPAPVAPVSAAPVADPPDVASDRDLDLTATASIPTRTAPTSERAAASTVTLQDASSEAATIKVDGRTVVVRVGDTIPGVGDVLAIIPGATPMLRTTGGVIAAATPER